MWKERLEGTEFAGWIKEEWIIIIVSCFRSHSTEYLNNLSIDDSMEFCIIIEETCSFFFFFFFSRKYNRSMRKYYAKPDTNEI